MVSAGRGCAVSASFVRNVPPGLANNPANPPARAAVRVSRDYWSEIVKISARNRIKGKVLEVTKGATTAHVRLEIAPGQVITASITNEAVDDLGLKAGATAHAVIKASDVMIAVE
jgi:molybdopterin-binding protein